VQPEDGGAISAADYALGFVDLIEKGDRHRAQVNRPLIGQLRLPRPHARTRQRTAKSVAAASPRSGVSPRPRQGPTA
jgi:hypothetical protein